MHSVQAVIYTRYCNTLNLVSAPNALIIPGTAESGQAPMQKHVPNEICTTFDPALDVTGTVQ